MHPTRLALITEAALWIDTPYKNVGCIRGVAANCAMLLYGVAKGAGALPPDAPAPKWYTPQLHMHSKEERLAEYIKAYGARETTEAEAGPGDIVLYRNGESHGHGAIIIDWPHSIIHTTPRTGCIYAHGDGGFLAQKPRRFFTLVAE